MGVVSQKRDYCITLILTMTVSLGAAKDDITDILGLGGGGGGGIYVYM